MTHADAATIVLLAMGITALVELLLALRGRSADLIVNWVLWIALVVTVLLLGGPRP